MENKMNKTRDSNYWYCYKKRHFCNWNWM